MKKKNLKSLKLNKKLVSNLSSAQIKGQGPNSAGNTCTTDISYDVTCDNHSKLHDTCIVSINFYCTNSDYNDCNPNTIFICNYSDLHCGETNDLD
ncbi:hypothetical protein [uncultured Kordia sp.]|uniref:hypothetical protein n=1 Tax=uncultured Kordia sp. TaxID=507699 RepID=UPI0026037D47|nr:hypothetical protein [uncultured Kordia sp.]